MLFGLATSNLRSFRDFYLSLLNKSNEKEDYKRGYREALDDMVNLGTVTIQEQIENLPDSSVSTDKLSDEKLQERCDRYEKALTEISNNESKYVGDKLCRGDLSDIARGALAAIGGDDEKV